MEKSDSQIVIEDKVLDEEPAELTASLSDTEFLIIIEADGYEAAYTADEARELVNNLLSVYHQAGWGRNIVPIADHICDLANVLDNKIPVEDVEQKWDHDGTVGGGQQYTLVADTREKAIMSFESKSTAMGFCGDWNSRPSWVIEYHLENNGDRVAIWNLNEPEGTMIAEHLEEEITRLISSDNPPDWDISVKHQPEVLGKETKERIFGVGVRNSNYQYARYEYQTYYAFDGKGINTHTQQPVTHSRRVRIDRHRGRILEAMSKIPKQLGLHFGSPDADLEWLTLEETLTSDHELP